MQKKQLNRSRCHLGCGLRWVKGSIIRWGAHWRHLTNMIEPSICGGDETFLWPPYGIGQVIIFLSCFFFFLLFSSPNLSGRRAAITLGIGPHSSCQITSTTCSLLLREWLSVVSTSVEANRPTLSPSTRTQ